MLVVLAVLLALTVSADTISAQTRSLGAAADVAVEVVSPPAYAAPGDLVTQVFRVRNLSPVPVETELILELPAGWFDLGLPTHVALQPHSSQDVFVTVILPAHTLGDHYLRLHVYTGTSIVTAKAAVFVRDVLGVDVRSPEGDERTFTGMRSTRTFTVTNTGNTPDTYLLTGESRRGWPVDVEPARVFLMPGESAAVEFHVTIPKDASGTDVLTLRAVSATNPDVEDKEQASIRVIGSLARPEPIVAVLPARLVFGYDPLQGSGRLTMTARGALDPARSDSDRLSLSVEAPIPIGGHHGKPRLSGFVYERGAARLAAGQVGVRWGSFARFSGYGLDFLDAGGSTSWGVTFIQDKGVALRGSTDREPYSVHGFIKAESAADSNGSGDHAVRLLAALGGQVAGRLSWAEWRLEAEAAARLDGGSGASGVRLAGNALSERHRLAVSVETTAAGITNGGASSRLSFALLTNTKWLGNAGLYAGLHMPAARFQGGNRTVEERLYLGRSLGPNAFGYVQQHSRAWFESNLLAKDEHGITLGARLTPLRGMPRTSVTMQLSTDRRTQSQSASTVRRSGVRLGMSLPIGAAWASGHADYRLVTGDGAEGRSLGFTLNLRAPVAQTGSLDFRWRQEWNLPSRQSSTRQTLRYSHRVTESFTLTARAERVHTSSAATWRIALEGEFHFHLPTPIPVKGTLRGQLVPLDPGINVDRLLVRAGELRALTDPGGVFVFPALPPGIHVLEVEGLPARVVTVPEEVTAEVRPGRTTEVEIGLQSTAGIDLRFIVAESADFQLPGRRPSLTGLRVHLVRDDEIIASGRVRNDGTLLFADLTPGAYDVVLDVDSLPTGVLALERRRTVTLGAREWQLMEWTLQQLPPIITFDPVKPSAAFTYTPQAPRAGEPVVFRERSTVDMQRGIASLEWDFGDGRTAAGADVTHIFDRPGRYTVTLTVTDTAGDSDTVSQIILVE